MTAYVMTADAMSTSCLKEIEMTMLLQEAAVWIPKDTQHQHQQNELMTVRLALARSVAQAHLSAVQPVVLVKA